MLKLKNILYKITKKLTKRKTLAKELVLSRMARKLTTLRSGVHKGGLVKGGFAIII